ncbi:MAG TPA: hypothetical protein VK335_24835 [Bryobacteraceae bacterium]|nr:hypothetical protein [Bryobacteraceae bacterium]
MTHQADGVQSVLLSVGIGGAIVILGLAAGAALFFYQHRQSERASAQKAEAEFRDLRARLGGRQPLVDMQERRPRAGTITPQPRRPLRSFHAVIFDTRGSERIVRITLPYRLLRWVGRSGSGFQYLGQLTPLDDTEFDGEPIRLLLDEIEQHGPGVVVDYRHPNGGQFLAWVD